MEEIFNWESIKQFLIFLVIFAIASVIAVKLGDIGVDYQDLKDAGLPYKKRRGNCYCIDCKYYWCKSRKINPEDDWWLWKYEVTHLCTLHGCEVGLNDSCKDGKRMITHFPRSNSV